MDLLTAFGLFAVTAMLVTYALEDQQPLVHPGLCRGLPARLGLWLPARRLAFWRARGGLGRRGGLALALQGRAMASQAAGGAPHGLNHSATPMLQCDGLKGPDFIGWPRASLSNGQQNPHPRALESPRDGQGQNLWRADACHPRSRGCRRRRLRWAGVLRQKPEKSGAARGCRPGRIGARPRWHRGRHGRSGRCS